MSKLRLTKNQRKIIYYYSILCFILSIILGASNSMWGIPFLVVGILTLGLYMISEVRWKSIEISVMKVPGISHRILVPEGSTVDLVLDMVRKIVQKSDNPVILDWFYGFRTVNDFNRLKRGIRSGEYYVLINGKDASLTSEVKYNDDVYILIRGR